MSKQKNPRPRKSKKGLGDSAALVPEVLVQETVPVEPAAVAAESVPAPVSMDAEIEMGPQVGFTAGKIWQALQEGPLSFEALKQRIDEPETVILLAAGWLAREDKLTLLSRAQRFELCLKEQLAHRA